MAGGGEGGQSTAKVSSMAYRCHLIRAIMRMFSDSARHITQSNPRNVQGKAKTKTRVQLQHQQHNKNKKEKQIKKKTAKRTGPTPPLPFLKTPTQSPLAPSVLFSAPPLPPPPPRRSIQIRYIRVEHPRSTIRRPLPPPPSLIAATPKPVGSRFGTEPKPIKKRIQNRSKT